MATVLCKRCSCEIPLEDAYPARVRGFYCSRCVWVVSGIWAGLYFLALAVVAAIFFT